MFSFIKQKKMLDDLSSIKKKQLVKQSQTIIENKNKIQQIHQLDLTEVPSTTRKTKKKNPKPSSSAPSATPPSITSNEEKSAKCSKTLVDNFNTELQNHFIKLAEMMQEKDSELANFYMRRFHLESACTDNVNSHSDNYIKCCQFCGHSFLDRNTGYQLAKQNSTKVVIKDVTRGDKLCSLNLKQFFTTKTEKMKWSHIVYCLCSQKDTNNTVLTFKCKQCQKYMIIPFDKTIASQIVPTHQKIEQKKEPVQNKEEATPNIKNNEKKETPTPNQIPNEKRNRKSSEKHIETTNNTAFPKKEQKPQALNEDEKKRKREDPPANNNNSKKKKNKNSATSTSASDFLKML